jgi:5'-3' exonuclease
MSGVLRVLNNRSYLLIDFSNVVYASFFGAIGDGRVDPERVPKFFDDHVRLFNKRVESLRQYHGMAEVIFALDRRPVKKYEIYPDYKKGRGKLKCEDGSFFDVKQPCLDELERQGATVVYAEDYEADDAIASFVAQNFYSEITVVSSDRDLWAILDHPNVKVLNFIKGEYISKQHLREAFCIKDKHKVITSHLTKYAHIKLFKILWGDSSDNIPNIMPRMKKQLLPFVLKSDGTWEDFQTQIDYNKLTDRCKTLLKENVDKVQVNTELVLLRYNLDLVMETYQPQKKGLAADPLTQEIDRLF